MDGMGTVGSTERCSIFLHLQICWGQFALPGQPGAARLPMSGGLSFGEERWKLE